MSPTITKSVRLGTEPCVDALSQIRNATVKVPTLSDVVVNHECVYSCDTPASPFGLFVNLETFNAVGRDFLDVDAGRTGATLYLNIVEQLERRDATTEPAHKVALNVPGGFADDQGKLQTRRLYGLYHVPSDVLIQLPISEGDGLRVDMLVEAGLPEHIARSVATISAQPAKTANLSQWEADIPISKYSETLVQCDNPPKIPMSNWKCQHCGNTKNLWMHLSDGYIGCGRKLYGIPETGCSTGEEGAAVRHHEAAPEQRPLAVKLGTLTPSSADVYSYLEDSMVIDSRLAEHLAHFGINIQLAEKTEKTLTEVELEYNKTFDWSRVVEADSELTPICREGAVGLVNFGNTCYMNSSLQLLTHLPEIVRDFGEETLHQLLATLKNNDDPASNLVLQFAKMVVGLTTKRYLQQREEALRLMSDVVRPIYATENPSIVLTPFLFRRVACKDHAEFSTSRQQDAEEFLRYIIDKLETHLRQSSSLKDHQCSFKNLFSFEIEEYLRPQNSHRVKVSAVEDMILSLPIPTRLQQQENGYSAESERKRLRSHQDSQATGACSFDVCFDEWMSGEEVELRVGSSQEGWTTGQKTRKLKTFPAYLCVQLRRFYLAPDWTAKKVAVPIMMPDTLDITRFRASGLEEGQELWEDDDEVQHAQLLADLEAMGFSRGASLKAVAALNTASPSVSSCVDWIISHMDDPSINEVPPKASSKSNLPKTTSETLSALGFTDLQIKAAMLENDGDEERSLDWIVSNDRTDDELRTLIASRTCAGESNTSSADPTLRSAFLDGDGRYQLVGFISHMGANASCGHYVCHLWDAKEGAWILFNDGKIAISKHPAPDMGYIYIYRRHS